MTLAPEKDNQQYCLLLAWNVWEESTIG